jgi:uncharacterized membrane protein
MATRRVLLAGETWTVTRIHTKGFDVVELGGYEDFSVHFRQALAGFRDVEITHIPNHLVMSSFPSTVEELRQFDVVIISDCGRNNLTMYPNMFVVPMGPDRVQVVADYVRQGGALVMAGGWLSFQGYQAKAGYHGSAIEEVLPVEISPFDDRVETTAGAPVRVMRGDHPVLAGIPEAWPQFLGYQRVVPKDGAEVLAVVGAGDPLITVWSVGDGRAMAFTSDLAPHWGTDFVKWDHYPAFWHQAIAWLAKGDSEAAAG